MAKTVKAKHSFLKQPNRSTFGWRRLKFQPPSGEKTLRCFPCFFLFSVNDRSCWGSGLIWLITFKTFAQELLLARQVAGLEKPRLNRMLTFLLQLYPLKAPIDSDKVDMWNTKLRRHWCNNALMDSGLGVNAQGNFGHRLPSKSR